MAITAAGKVFLTVEDIHEKTGWNIRTIRDMIRRGELKGAKRGRSYYVPEDNLAAYLEGEGQREEKV